MVGSSDTHRWSDLARIVAPPALILLSFIPLIVLHLKHLWHTGLYTHFPLIVAVSVYSLWNQWPTQLHPSLWRAVATGLVTLISFVILSLAVLLWSPWLGYVAFMASVAALLWQLNGGPLRNWLPAWLLLALLLPLPLGLDQALSLRLQDVSAEAGSLFLDFFHIQHLQSDNVLEIPGVRFSTEQAFRGLQSLYVLIGAGALIAVFFRHGWLHVIGLVAAAMFWAVMADMFRLAGIVFAASQFAIDLSTGWRHDVWGLIMFAFAVAMILSTDRLLWVVCAPMDNSDEEIESPEHGSGFETRGKTGSEPDEDEQLPSLGAMGSWTVAGMFLCLGVAQLFPRTAQSVELTKYSIPLGSWHEDTLAAELAGWHRGQFESIQRRPSDSLGAHSAIWHFSRQEQQATVSLDYPFSAWRPLDESYRSRGYRILNWKTTPLHSMELASVRLPDAEAVVIELELEDKQPATLLFAQWSADGKLLSPPQPDVGRLELLVGDLRRRWSRAYGPAPEHCVYQLQVLSATSHALSKPDHFPALQQLFSESLRVLHARTKTVERGAE